MILYSTRARVAGFPPDVAAWSGEIVKLASQILGNEVTVASRIGGHQDMIWTSRVKDLAVLEADLDKLQQNAQYHAMIKTAIDKGYFDPASIETAVWRTL